MPTWSLTHIGICASYHTTSTERDEIMKTNARVLELVVAYLVVEKIRHSIIRKEKINLCDERCECFTKV